MPSRWPRCRSRWGALPLSAVPQISHLKFLVADVASATIVHNRATLGSLQWYQQCTGGSAPLLFTWTQVAELRSAQLDWQQNVLQGRLATLREDSGRITANDRLKVRMLARSRARTCGHAEFMHICKRSVNVQHTPESAKLWRQQEELSTTLSELEQKMAVLDADLTWRAVEAEKLQVHFASFSLNRPRSATPQADERHSAPQVACHDAKQRCAPGKLQATCAAACLTQASLEAATGAKAPPPPTYNGTKVHAAVGDGGGGGTSSPLGGSVPIDEERLRAPLAAAAAGEKPASQRPAGSKAFGERAAVGSAVMQACSVQHGEADKAVGALHALMVHHVTMLLCEVLACCTCSSANLC
jgi:hypothetical protein